MTGLHPNTELVAMAWIASIPSTFGNFSTQMVATQPPPEQSWPVNQDNIANFVTVTTVGGTPMQDAPIQQPVVEVKAWATKPGSNKPPWFAANDLLMRIRYASQSRLPGVYGRALTIEANGRPYAGACVIQAIVHTEPRRVYSDPRNWACYTMDMTMSWREAGLVVQ